MERYEQVGPTRGAVACREVRGESVWDGDVVGLEPEHPTCGTGRTPAGLGGRFHSFPTAELGVDAAASVDSCLGEFEAGLDLDRLLPLQQRTQYSCTTSSRIIIRRRVRGDHPGLRHLDRQVETFNGSSIPQVRTVTTGYNPTPYHTPIEISVETNDGLSRKMTSSWSHYDEWFFAKKSDVKLTSDGSAYMTTTYERQAEWPYALLRATESSGGRSRVTDYGLRTRQRWRNARPSLYRWGYHLLRVRQGHATGGVHCRRSRRVPTDRGQGALLL